jgi:hypothetical protein
MSGQTMPAVAHDEQDELDLTVPRKADPAALAAEDAWRSAELIADRAWRAAEGPRPQDDFDKLHADVNRALNWIAFRNNQKLRLTANERRDELHHRLIYSRADGVVDGNPQRAIMLAMRRGDLVAFDKTGDPLPREFWAHHGFDWRGWPAVVFRCSELLAAFPMQGPIVREVLSESLANNPKLTQAQAWEIIKGRCKNARRQEMRDLWESLGGSTVRGPKGPRMIAPY